MVELLKQFLNPTDFPYLSVLEMYFLLPIGEQRLISLVVYTPWLKDYDALFLNPTDKWGSESTSVHNDG